MLWRQTEALILGHTELGEADRIITLISPEYGKLKGAVRGSRNPKSRMCASTQPLTHAQVIFREKKNTDLHRISQCDIITPFTNLRGDLERLAGGLYIAELAAALTPMGEENRPLFQLLLWALNRLEAGAGVDKTLRIWEVRLLSLLGYGPELGVCVGCGKPVGAGGASLVPARGGLLCGGCLSQNGSGVPLSLGSLNFLRRALDLDIEKLGRLNLTQSSQHELKTAMRRYLTYQVNYDLHTYRFLDLLGGGPAA